MINKSFYTVLLISFLCITFSCTSLISNAFCLEDTQEISDDTLFFEDDDFGDGEYGTEDTGPEATEQKFQTDGFIKIGSVWNYDHQKPDSGETDWRGLSRLRGDIHLEFLYKPTDSWKIFASGTSYYDIAYRLNGRGGYTDEVIDNYENETELDDTYIQGKISDNIDIVFGRQIVVWGKSDNLRVTDILNPLNLREPGITDIEDLRLPVTMTKFSFFNGNIEYTAIAVHEVRYNKTPERGSDFYPYSESAPVITEDKPEESYENNEIALSVSGEFQGWDAEFYYADHYDDSPYLDTESGKLEHARLKMFGTSVNIVEGNWVLKGEAALFDGIKYSSVNNEFTRMDLLSGFEYSGVENTDISYEIVYRHISDYSQNLSLLNTQEENSFQSALRVSHNLLNETLTLTFLAGLYGLKGEDGSFQRLSCEYDVIDSLKSVLGVVIYQDGDSAIRKNIDENDRIFLNVKFSF